VSNSGVYFLNFGCGSCWLCCHLLSVVRLFVYVVFLAFDVVDDWRGLRWIICHSKLAWELIA